MLYPPLIVAAVLPSLLLVWYFHARDTFPEPASVLWATFGFGCLSVVPAVLLGATVEPVLQSRNPLSTAAFQAFVIAALCEEVAKLSVLLGYSFRHSAFDEPMDGIVYGAAASLGFATLENTLYVIDGGFLLAFMRGLLSVPGHATYGAVMGYYVGRARFDRANRVTLVLKGLSAAVLLHGCYDLPLMLLNGREELPAIATGGQAGLVTADPLGWLLVLSLGAVVGGWTWALTLVRRVRREQDTHRPKAVESAPAAGPWTPALPVTVPDSAPGALVPARAGRQFFGPWMAVIGGGLAASLGALLIAVAIGLALTGQVEPGDGLYFAVGITIAGGLPVVVGLVVFILGIRVLNRGRAGRVSA